MEKFFICVCVSECAFMRACALTFALTLVRPYMHASEFEKMKFRFWQVYLFDTEKLQPKDAGVKANAFE